MRAIIFSVLALLPLLGTAQVTYNTDCGSAWFITPDGDFSAEYDMGPDCRDEAVMYYYYRATSTLSDVVVCNILVSGVSSPANSSFEVFGPYTSQSVACSSITGSTVPLVSGSSSTSLDVEHDLEENMTYILKLTTDECVGSMEWVQKSESLALTREDESCPNCIGSFQPTEGTYVLSAWVKDANASGSTLTYVKPSIDVTSNSVVMSCTPTGDIIDGWQRIETKVEIDAGSFSMKFQCATGGDCYFDDVRFFPVDGSMVTYVYDPITLRLMAELDERNYAKLYEYDEEGKLIRVKKETEKGIMTIQETRDNNSGR